MCIFFCRTFHLSHILKMHSCCRKRQYSIFLCLSNIPLWYVHHLYSSMYQILKISQTSLSLLLTQVYYILVQPSGTWLGLRNASQLYSNTSINSYIMKLYKIIPVTPHIQNYSSIHQSIQVLSVSKSLYSLSSTHLSRNISQNFLSLLFQAKHFPHCLNIPHVCADVYTMLDGALMIFLNALCSLQSKSQNKVSPLTQDWCYVLE